MCQGRACPGGGQGDGGMRLPAGGIRASQGTFSGSYFSYFCSKHRLWVHVRTRGGSNEYPQTMFWMLGIPLYTPVVLYKRGVFRGIHFIDMFS